MTITPVTAGFAVPKLLSDTRTSGVIMFDLRKPNLNYVGHQKI